MEIGLGTIPKFGLGLVLGFLWRNMGLFFPLNALGAGISTFMLFLFIEFMRQNELIRHTRFFEILFRGWTRHSQELEIFSLLNAGFAVLIALI